MSATKDLHKTVRRAEWLAARDATEDYVCVDHEGTYYVLEQLRALDGRTLDVRRDLPPEFQDDASGVHAGGKQSRLVDIVHAEHRGEYRVFVRFSDGMQGVRDFSDVIAQGGPMVEALRASDFALISISMGVLTWPNGFDVDTLALYREMKEAGALAEAPPPFESPRAAT
jgi:hypothetical protein